MIVQGLGTLATMAATTGDGTAAYVLPNVDTATGDGVFVVRMVLMMLATLILGVVAMLLVIGCLCQRIYDVTTKLSKAQLRIRDFERRLAQGNWVGAAAMSSPVVTCEAETQVNLMMNVATHCAEPYPESIFISPKGECFHVVRECPGLRKALSVSERRICDHCRVLRG